MDGDVTTLLAILTVKKLFPDVQREPPMFQSAIAFGPAPGNHRKQPGTIFFTPSIQVFIDIDKIPPEPSFSSSREISQLFQPFLSGEMLYAFNHLQGPSLAGLQYVHVSSIVIHL